MLFAWYVVLPFWIRVLLSHAWFGFFFCFFSAEMIGRKGKSVRKITFKHDMYNMGYTLITSVTSITWNWTLSKLATPTQERKRTVIDFFTKFAGNSALGKILLPSVNSDCDLRPTARECADVRPFLFPPDFSLFLRR
jgi:hypothetical protein